MPRFKFTPEIAREMRKRATIAREKNSIIKATEQERREALLRTLMQEREEHPPVTDDYIARRIARVRAQMDKIDQMLMAEDNAQAIDRLAAAMARLSEQERILAGRPLPGSHRPTKAPRSKAGDSTVVPE